ncbi:MAG: ATP-binding protein [Chloroflexota bacterium]|nr:ATP-binding protein [Chloroflexota bacterium]
MFYGREEDINILKDNLTRTGTKTVIVLFGQRCSGKTTLLFHLINTAVLEQHIPIMVDMQTASYGISVSKLLRDIAYAIAKEFRKRGMPVTQPRFDEFERDPTFTFNTFLDEAEEQVLGRKIILLIDEFDYMIQKIRDLTADQPFLIHLLCRALVDHCNQQCKAYVTMNDVNTVLDEVLKTGGEQFAWILAQIDPVDRVVLSALAEKVGDEGRFLSLLDIQEICTARFISLTNDVLLESLKKLCNLEVVVSKSDDEQVDRAERARYCIPVGLLRIWLRKEKPMEVLLREEKLNNEQIISLQQAKASKRKRNNSTR